MASPLGSYLVTSSAHLTLRSGMRQVALDSTVEAFRLVGLGSLKRRMVVGGSDLGLH